MLPYESRALLPSPAQAFMRGKRLDWGKGVTWDLAHGHSQVFVADVATREGVHLFG